MKGRSDTDHAGEIARTLVEMRKAAETLSRLSMVSEVAWGDEHTTSRDAASAALESAITGLVDLIVSRDVWVRMDAEDALATWAETSLLRTLPADAAVALRPAQSRILAVGAAIWAQAEQHGEAAVLKEAAAQMEQQSRVYDEIGEAAAHVHNLLGRERVSAAADELRRSAALLRSMIRKGR